MFFPKTDSTLYSSTNLGNLAREVVTSWKQLKDQVDPDRRGVSLTLMAAASARKMMVREGHTETWKIIVLNLSLSAYGVQ